MAAKTTPSGASAPAPKPEQVLECHAFVRSDGGWRRMKFALPEGVASEYVVHVSDSHDFFTLLAQLDHELYLQKERG